MNTPLNSVIAHLTDAAAATEYARVLFGKRFSKDNVTYQKFKEIERALDGLISELENKENDSN